MTERPTWSPGECPWAAGQGHTDYRLWCSGWQKFCEPKACQRKAYEAKERARLMRQYRDFPGNPFQVSTKAKMLRLRAEGVADAWTAALPKGHCRWCGAGISNEKKPGTLNLRRTWHSACLHRYNLHTRAENQQWHLVERDGICCKACGTPVGRWAFRREWVSSDTVFGHWDESSSFVSEGPDGPMCRVHWASGLEVDHVLALALVVIQIHERFRWKYWGPMNLQGLCARCHSSKTKTDIAAIKAARLTLGAAPPL